MTGLLIGQEAFDEVLVANVRTRFKFVNVVLVFRHVDYLKLIDLIWLDYKVI